MTSAETASEDQTAHPERKKSRRSSTLKKGKMNMQLVESRLDPSSGKSFPAGSKCRVIFKVIAHSCSKLRRQTLNYSDAIYSGLHYLAYIVVVYTVQMNFPVSSMPVYLYRAMNGPCG